jgi:hypothetical protein
MSSHGNETIKRSLAFIVWLAAILGSCNAAGQTIQTAEIQPPAPTTEQRLLIVSIADRKLLLVQNGALKKVYPVAVGKASTPSPAGSFSIVRRVSNPTYSHKGRVVGPGPKNPVGSRWMGLSLKGYGIHGTNEPNSIGKAASHGCIRMAKADLEELYAQVQVGDEVEIHAEHDGAVDLALSNMITAPPTSAPAIAAPVVLVAGNSQVTNEAAIKLGGQ